MRLLIIAGCFVLHSLSGCASMKAGTTSAKPGRAQASVPADSESQSIQPPQPSASPAQTVTSSIDDTGPSSAASVEHSAPATTTKPVSSATRETPEESKPSTGDRTIKQPNAAVTSPRRPTVQATPSNNPPATPTLDLAALKQRLRDTHAIGVFTKLSLKNQVDDLLNEFRTLYGGPNKHPPPELRQRYDLLLLKVLSLLQDNDPQLAAAISSSREAIWGILADPDKFATI
jgi:hypothetical protein